MYFAIETTRITLSGDWPIIFFGDNFPWPLSPRFRQSLKSGRETSPQIGCCVSPNAFNFHSMQRLFPMFPRGGPGLGLLLLRISVAAIFMLNITNRFGLSSRFSGVVVALILLISISLCIGFLTPFLSVIAFVTAAVNLLLGAQVGPIIIIGILSAAAALIFLGPGAYSVDAKLFGLRVTVFPRRKDTNRLQIFI